MITNSFTTDERPTILIRFAFMRSPWARDRLARKNGSKTMMSSAGATTAFNASQAVAVVLTQRVLGAKQFVG